jgi:hypothetical protein
MCSALLISLACIAVNPPTPEVATTVERSDPLAAYNAARVKVGRDPDAHVRLALWCEAHGLQSERLKHLALAVLTDPGHATARGLMGLVAFRGRWHSPEAVAAQVDADEAFHAALSEYNARRARMSNSAGAHWKLALWCEQHGLKPEATVHLTVVTQLEPGYEAAWKRLGYKKRRMRWATDEQVAAEQAEAQAQKKADEFWLRRLAPWLSVVEDPKRQSELNQALAAVTDPRAVPSIWWTFARGTPAHQKIAVQVLGQIDSPRASRALALLAVVSKAGEVRKKAIQSLHTCDSRDGAFFLASLLRDRMLDPDPDPILYRFAFYPIGLDRIDTPGVLFVRGPRYNVLWTYTVDESFTSSFASYEKMATYPDRLMALRQQQLSDLSALIDRILGESAIDLQEADDHDRRVDRANARIIQTLSAATGLDLGKDPEAWRKWWREQQGYAYESPPARPSHDLKVFVDTPTYTENIHYSCFAAGTPVHTLTGPRPIESVTTGDQVLTQDPRTGALSFQPVLAAVRNKPDAVWKINLGQETIQATGIHRFWKVGQGWTMARDLKPGDSLRALGAVAEVKAVELDRVQPVFNLKVMQAESFFVGERGMLVHDNSPVQPVPRPFDLVQSIAEPTDRSVDGRE